MIELYYQNAEANFGDILSRDIVSMVSGQRVSWAPLKSAGLVALGSLGERVLKKRFRRYFLNGLKPLPVWGTGFLAPGGASGDSALAVYALRGKHSAMRLKVKRDIALGDPGFLCNQLYPAMPRVDRRITCIAHAADTQQVVWKSAIQRIFPHYHVSSCSIQAPVPEVAQAISCSELIVTTAMHPLIAAAAYGIPAVWLLPPGLHVGAGYKFEDAFSVTGCQPAPILLDELLKGAISADRLMSEAQSSVPERELVVQVQRGLTQSFVEMQQSFFHPAD